MVGSRDHRIQFWKGAIQGPFHQSLVQIGPVASEELIKMWKVNGQTTEDGRSVVTIANLTLWVRWAKQEAPRSLKSLTWIKAAFNNNATALWWPSWSEGGTTKHNFGRGPSNDYFIKVWFQLCNWFQTRRFLCEFPIGSYVKLSSAVGAILIEGPNRRTHFWKRTIQWVFHQNFVLIEQMVSDKKIFMGISHRVLC